MSCILINLLDKIKSLNCIYIMKVTDFIKDYIARIPQGYIFTYRDIIPKVKKKEAIIKALNRLANSGKIVKISRGKFYKPEYSSFGKLKPDLYQIAKDLLEKNGKPIGYLTGYSVYNQLGLTTQVSNLIQIGRNTPRPPLVRGKYKISFVLQKNNITRNNIKLLQILDSLRYIKKIPDTTIELATEKLLEIIKNLSSKEKKLLVHLALKYPPSSRALLGAILDEINNTVLTKRLMDSLNPITTYKLKGVNRVLSFSNKWNIK